MTLLERIAECKRHGHDVYVEHDGTEQNDNAAALYLEMGIREVRREWGEDVPSLMIIRSRDPEVIKKADILVDVGATVYGEDAYNPEKNRFDHHQDLKTLPASYRMIAEHRVEPHIPGFMKEAEQVFNWWDSTGQIDRFGLWGEDGDGFHPAELVRQPAGDGMLIGLRRHTFIAPGFWLHTALKMCGKFLIEEVGRVPLQARKIEKNHEMLRFEKENRTIDVLVTPEYGDGKIFHRANVSYDLSIYEHEGEGHIYTNPRQFSLSPLDNPRTLMKNAQLHKPGMLQRMQKAQKMMEPANFVHGSGHLAGYDTIGEAQESLEGLLLAKGWNQQE